MKKILGLLLALAFTVPAFAADNILIAQPNGTNAIISSTGSGNPVVQTLNVSCPTCSAGGTPGGSTTQVQYNNAGAFGGISGWTTNGTTNLTGSTSAVLFWSTDLTLSRSAAGVLQVGTTAANALGSLNLANLTASGIVYIKNNTRNTGAYSITSVDTTSLGLNTTTAAISLSNRLGNDTYVNVAQNVIQINADNGIRLLNNTTGDSTLTTQGVGIWQMGVNSSATAAVPQTLQAGGSSGNSAAAALFTIAGSDQAGTTTTGGEVRIRGGNGTSAGGAVTIYTSATTTPAVAVTIAANKNTTLAGQLLITNIASDSGQTDATVCADSTTALLYKGSGTLGICLGTSGRQFKTDFAPMTEGLTELMELPLQTYRYIPGYGDNGKRQQFGLMAQDVEKVMPILAGHNINGETINYDYGALLFVVIKAIQEQQVQIENLKQRLQ